MSKIIPFRKHKQIGTGLRNAGKFECLECAHRFNHPLLDVVNCPKCSSATRLLKEFYANYPYQK